VGLSDTSNDTNPLALWVNAVERSLCNPSLHGASAFSEKKVSGTIFFHSTGIRRLQKNIDKILSVARLQYAGLEKE